jgi:hypothetical protein
MGYIKPFARSITGLLSVILAGWGALVTEDLLVIFGAIALAGALNFFIGLADERDIRRAKIDAAEDRKILRSLQEFTERAFPQAEIPIRLRNLNNVSNLELKKLASEISAGLRKYSVESGEYTKSSPIWDRVPRYFDLSKEEQDILWKREQTELAQRHSDRARIFDAEQRPDALAVWEQLKLRTSMSNHPTRKPIAIELGVLAGIKPIEESATAIETLARHLGD